MGGRRGKRVHFGILLDCASPRLLRKIKGISKMQENAACFRQLHRPLCER